LLYLQSLHCMKLMQMMISIKAIADFSL